MTSPVKIRPGRASDQSAIDDIATGTFSWGDYVPQEFANWLQEPDCRVLVATNAEDHAVAVVHVKMMSTGEGWLSGARVHPHYRRQGIGTLLNDRGVEWARTQGAKVVRLTAEEENSPARSQVEKLGYRPVARFVLSARSLATPGLESNGGRRLPGPEQFDLAPAAEAESAFMVWSLGDLARTAHGLFGAEGWSFRKLMLADLTKAASIRHLWICPSGWAIASEDEDALWVSLLVTTPDDADRAIRALTDLALETGKQWLDLMIPRIGWLDDALMRGHLELKHPNVVYEKLVS
jgi:ribosomal protein S18 acetylase RimI-like enzyme